jgi:hypothetical protein
VHADTIEQVRRREGVYKGSNALLTDALQVEESCSGEYTEGHLGLLCKGIQNRARLLV